MTQYDHLITTQVSYLYTNYPGERVPLPLACDLINESDTAEPLRGSAMTFVLSIESSTAYIGYLMSASGPDLCTLSMPPTVVCIDDNEGSIAQLWEVSDLSMVMAVPTTNQRSGSGHVTVLPSP